MLKFSKNSLALYNNGIIGYEISNALISDISFTAHI